MTFIDIADLPPALKRGNTGVTARLRAIPEGKALALYPPEGKDLRDLQTKIPALARHIQGRCYRSRTDNAKGCLWVWWETSR